mmetsp:Transcript_25527/g.56158  ORF Transcript_25527/g.56158 Transcript_25527/m.56158 type:complete len:149 (+) Transcript_25527:65-511(+)
MGKMIKAGRVCIVTAGRMAGKKAVVVKTFDEGSKARPFGHALVAGVEKEPMRVTKRMSKKKVAKKAGRVKAFVRYINYTHFLPTRYMIPAEIDCKGLVSDAQMDSPEGRKEAKKAIKEILKEKFMYCPLDKTGKPSKDILFLKRKLRF